MTTTSLHELRVPSLGESVSEATIATWVKAEGEHVEPGDVVAELETDKATIELPAGQTGVLHILKPKGTTIAVGDVIAQIDPAGQAGTPASAPQATPVAVAPAAPAAAPAVSATAPASSETLAPAVQRLVTEHQLDPSKITGSGKEGRLTKEDVLAYLAKGGMSNGADTAAAANTQRSNTAQKPMSTPGTTSVYAPATPAAPTAPAAPAAGSETRVEMSKLRQTIARRLVEAQHATASLTTFNEIDLSAVMGLREKYKEKFEKTHNIGLGFMSFFAKAVVHGLRAVPAVNAMIDGSQLVYRSYVHLGVAVSTEKGLMVPVIRNADQLSMAQIEGEIKRLAARAREGKITPDEMAGGTFTITNGGVFGSLLSTPILNPPQSGILGMHKIEKRAVVVSDEKGQDTIAVRPMMYVALTYDHRVIDGQQSVTFLVKVKEAIEDPARLLLEI